MNQLFGVLRWLIFLLLFMIQGFLKGKSVHILMSLKLTEDPRAGRRVPPCSVLGGCRVPHWGVTST